MVGISAMVRHGKFGFTMVTQARPPGLPKALKSL